MYIKLDYNQINRNPNLNQSFTVKLSNGHSRDYKSSVTYTRYCMIRDNTMPVCKDKNASRTFKDVSNKSIFEAWKELKEYSQVACGITHFERNVLVLDMDGKTNKDGAITEWPNAKACNDYLIDRGYEPSYVLWNPESHHCQAGFLMETIKVKDITYQYKTAGRLYTLSTNEDGRNYLALLHQMNQDLQGDINFTGYNCKNPYSDKFETIFNNENEIKIKKENIISSNIIYNTPATFFDDFVKKAEIDEERFSTITVNNQNYSYSRNSWIYQEASKLIRNNNNNLSAFQIADLIYGKWPSEYNKLEPYSYSDAVNTIQSLINKYNPVFSEKRSADEYKHSLTTRRLKTLIRYHYMLEKGGVHKKDYDDETQYKNDKRLYSKCNKIYAKDIKKVEDEIKQILDKEIDKNEDKIKYLFYLEEKYTNKKNKKHYLSNIIYNTPVTFFDESADVWTVFSKTTESINDFLNNYGIFSKTA